MFYNKVNRSLIFQFFILQNQINFLIKFKKRGTRKLKNSVLDVHGWCYL